MENIITQIIELSGLNLTKIAKATGIDRTYLSRMKNGVVEISGKNENLLRYCYKDILKVEDEYTSEDISMFEKIMQQQRDINNSTGNHILNIMNRFNIDQTKIAEDTKLSRGYVNKLYTGKWEISEKTIRILKKVYGEIGVNDATVDETKNIEEITTTNSDKKHTENMESPIGLNETSVHSIIETNRNISRTLEKMVDTNMKFAELFKSILPPKTETYQGVHQDVLTKMSQMLEYLVEVGVGKRWETKEDGIVELNKRFYGNAEVSTEMDTHAVKDKKSRS